MQVMSHTMKYASMQVTALTPEFHERTCGYWYTVTTYGATSHTAFATKAALLRWLEERGLQLDGVLPETVGEFATMPVIGEYYEKSHGEHASTEDEPYRMIAGDEFYALRPVVVTVDLSNGRYTLALITEDDAGVRTVHTINPNVKTRLEPADQAAMRALMR
jgi:hypothetical protein